MFRPVLDPTLFETTDPDPILSKIRIQIRPKHLDPDP